jgi:beta-mannosidase
VLRAAEAVGVTKRGKLGLDPAAWVAETAIPAVANAPVFKTSRLLHVIRLFPDQDFIRRTHYDTAIITFMARFSPLRSFLLVVAFLSTSALAWGKPIAIKLDHGWNFRMVSNSGLGTVPVADSTRWRPAQVPGSVQTDLLAQSLVPQPFVGLNEGSLQWIDKYDWEYRRTLVLSSEQLSNSHVDLVFEGLDTLADVFVNGHQVLHADNQFRTWRVELKPMLHIGENTLRVVFLSPSGALRQRMSGVPYHLMGQATGPLAGDPDRNSPTIEPYIRKADYSFGWDWGPRFVTMGLWRPVRLELWSGTRIDDVFVEQQQIDPRMARLLVHVHLLADRSRAVRLHISGGIHIAGNLSRSALSVQLAAGQNDVTVPLEIVHPQLWWPNGSGPQTLYKVVVTLVADSHTIDRKSRDIGLRTIVLRRADDRWGRSFEFVVNGVPIFAKGANVIPFDSFPARVTEEKESDILHAARDASMNILRVWGGGYYETDHFYDLCDRLGLLVWQDFMFTGGLYPGDADFFDNVRAEAKDHLLQLRNHPSLALLCGNNEGEIGWFFWNGQQRLKAAVTAEQRDTIWGDYLRLFTGLLPQAVAEFAPGTPYWSSSPGTNFEAGERDTDRGDQHTYAVWHGALPFSDYDKEFPRFMTEYGFESYPAIQTLRTIASPANPEADLQLDSPVMREHQKSSEGNRDISRELEHLFGKPRNFASLVYLSQLQQAEAVKYSTEHLRRARPRVMGAIYWQLNDDWPGASWSSIDYYGNWKALHYYAKRFFGAVLVSPYESNDAFHVDIVNDHPYVSSGNLELTLESFTGKTLWSQATHVSIKALADTHVTSIPLHQLLDGVDAGDVVLRVQLSDDAGKLLSSNDHFFAPDIALKLPPPEVSMRTSYRNGSLYLTVYAKSFARGIDIEAQQRGLLLSDNFFDLLAGESREIRVDGTASSLPSFTVTALDSARRPADKSH